LSIALRSKPETEKWISRMIDAGQLQEYFFGDEKMLRRVLQRARENLYALNDSRYTEGSLGVPVIIEGKAEAGLAMKYIRAGMERNRVIDHYLPRLRNYADKIGHAVVQ
jgi:DNA-binding IclR family transcriptional regulator